MDMLYDMWVKKMRTIIACTEKTYKNSSYPIFSMLMEHPSGVLLPTEIIKGIASHDFDRIVFIINEKISTNLKLMEEIILETFEHFGIEPEFFTIKNSSGYEELYIRQCIKKLKIVGELFIVFTDHLFSLGNYSFPKENAVFVWDIKKSKDLSLQNKISLNIKEGKFIKASAENIIGDYIFLGLFLQDARKFKHIYCKAFLNRKKTIEDFVERGLDETIKVIEAQSCIDVSNTYFWKKFLKNYKTIFVSLEGVLIKKRFKGRSDNWGMNKKPIKKNIRTLNELYEKGYSYIIIFTSFAERKELFDLLSELDIKYHRVIGDVPNYRRMLVNPFNSEQYNPSAIAINIKRNDGDLSRSAINE